MSTTNRSIETYPAINTAARRTMPDVAKAIGMVLVVLGHAWPGESLAVHAIYSFHMPLFFVISGMLMSEEKLQLPWRKFVGRQVRALLVPYLCFAALSLALWHAGRNLAAGMLPHDRFDAHWTLWDGFLATLYGSGHRIRGVNPSLWFFGAMFFCTLGYYALRRCVGVTAALVIATAICPLAVWVRRQSSEVLPWSCDVAMACLVFYAAGRSIGDVPLETIAKRRPWIAWFGGTALLLAGIRVGLWHDRIDVRTLRFEHTGLFLLAASLSVAGLLLISAALPTNRVCRELSRQALGIFSLHMFALVAARAIANRWTPAWIHEGLGEFSLANLVAVIALLGSYGISLAISRMFPWWMGQLGTRNDARDPAPAAAGSIRVSTP